jgi:hypothetical protein
MPYGMHERRSTTVGVAGACQGTKRARRALLRHPLYMLDAEEEVRDAVQARSQTGVHAARELTSSEVDALQLLPGKVVRAIKNRRPRDTKQLANVWRLLIPRPVTAHDWKAIAVRSLYRSVFFKLDALRNLYCLLSPHLRGARNPPGHWQSTVAGADLVLPKWQKRASGDSALSRLPRTR